MVDPKLGTEQEEKGKDEMQDWIVAAMINGTIFIFIYLAYQLLN